MTWVHPWSCSLLFAPVFKYITDNGFNPNLCLRTIAHFHELTPIHAFLRDFLPVQPDWIPDSQPANRPSMEPPLGPLGALADRPDSKLWGWCWGNHLDRCRGAKSHHHPNPQAGCRTWKKWGNLLSFFWGKLMDWWKGKSKPETMDFTMKYWVFCKCYFKTIHWKFG